MQDNGTAEMTPGNAKKRAEFAATKKLAWTSTEDGTGRWAEDGPILLIRTGSGSLYAVDRPSGRCFRSITRGSDKLTAGRLDDFVHHAWLRDVLAKVPGGRNALQRAAGVEVTAPVEVGRAADPAAPGPGEERLGLLTVENETKTRIIQTTTRRAVVTRATFQAMLEAIGAGMVPRDAKVVVGEDGGFPIALEWSEVEEATE